MTKFSPYILLLQKHESEMNLGVIQIPKQIFSKYIVIRKINSGEIRFNRSISDWKCY